MTTLSRPTHTLRGFRRALIVLPMVVGWASASPAAARPLSLEAFFNGRLVATGTVANSHTGTKRAFTMAMQASWAGPRGTLVEDVAYADGEREHKVWSFDKVGDGRFTGHRADVTEDAAVVEDEQGIRMTYKAKTRVPTGLTLDLSFDDRLTAIAPDQVALRSDVSYLFVAAAQVTMTITKTAAK